MSYEFNLWTEYDFLHAVSWDIEHYCYVLLEKLGKHNAAFYNNGQFTANNWLL